MDTNNLAVLKKIAQRMRDPDQVRAQIERKDNQNPSHLMPPWKSLSLSHGYPGLLTLFSTLESLFPEEGWLEVSHSYVLKIKEAIEKEGIHDLSLFGGLAGCCFAIFTASQKMTRYQKLLSKLNQHLCSEGQKAYILPLREKLELGIPARAELYDPISGIIGIGAYALYNRYDRDLDALLKEILTICVRLSTDIQIGKYTVPGWYIPSHYQFTEEDKQLFPKGSFNLGMAHGVSSLLAFLSLCSSQNISIQGQQEAVQRISTWILSKKTVKEGEIYWRDRISFEEEIGSKNAPSYFTMDAWCYGTLGISRSLYLAGKALSDAKMQQEALEAFLSGIKRVSDSPLSNPTFCHGIAGALAMTRLMARDTQEKSLEKSAADLGKRLMSLYSSEYLFGFKDEEALIGSSFTLNSDSTNKQTIKLDNIGLLAGVSGVILSQLPSSAQSQYWTYPFLIDGGL